MRSKVGKGQEPIPYQALLDENHALSVENHSLQGEVQSLRSRLEEAEELKRAISEGDLDALVIPGPEGELIFTLDSADRAYRVLVETMNEGTATLAFDGTILYCNRQFAELLKMPLQAITGTSIYRFVAAENAIKFKALLKQEAGRGEINLQSSGGMHLPVYLSVSSLKSHGSPNAWCLVATDLTEQKKNEEIVAAERLARSIIEQAAEAIAVCDTSGRITHFSNAMPKLCGCDPTFQIFENLIDVQFSEGEDAGKSILPVSSALKGLSILGVEATFGLEDCHNFHNKSHLLLNSGSLRNDNGNIIGCVVTLADITESKLAEHSIRRYNHILEGINQIFSSVVQAKTEEELGNTCLSVALEVTSGGIGFIGLLGDDGLLHDIAISDMGWEQCLMHEKTGHCRPPGNFVLHGLYGHVVDSGKDFYTNNPPLHPNSIGLPYGHPPITSFLGVPLVLDEKMMGMISVANREGGYSSEQQKDLKSIAPAVVQALQRKKEEQEHKQAEEALRESEEKYRNIIETANEGIWIIDPEARITYANKKMAEMLGCSQEEMTGRSAWSFTDEIGKVAAEQNMEKRKQGINGSHELKLIRKNGLPLWAIVNAKPLFDKDGKFIGSMKMLTDITERKQLEANLKRNEQHLNDILSSIQDGFFELDQEWRLAYINQRAARNGGFEPEDLIGEIVWEKFPYMTGSDLEAAYKRVMETRLPAHIETKSLIRNQWYEISIYPSTSGISVFWRDITERKWAEEELHEAYKQIQTQSEELRTFNEELRTQSEELKAANEALYESEKRFRTLLKILQI